MTHVVIMAGGIGSRFWPLSVPEYPKQFIDILGCGRSLIQLTVDRFKGICPDENFWVVTNERYVDIVREQIPTIPAHHILAEPAARNTAPCIAWACWSIRKEDSDANVVVTPSDAVVMNPFEFQRVLKNALKFTKENTKIVTIGIKPNRPETGYGYVKVTDDYVVGEILKVEAFKEKPNFKTATEYLASGNYLWNAGIFVWHVNTVINAIRINKPSIAAYMDEMMLEKKDVSETLESRISRIFPQCEKISIDFAVMEPESLKGNVYTHPADFGWSDLGNWHSLHEKLKKDEHNNAVIGNVRLFECSNCVVHYEGKSSFTSLSHPKLVLQGLDGYIISEKNGQILICKRSEEQRIKEFSAE